MAPPAVAVLGSTLLDLELERQRVPRSDRTWKLGIKDLDRELPNGLWTCGKVIGVLSEEGSSLSEQVLSQHLLTLFTQGTRLSHDDDGCFIIAQHNSTVVTNLHSALTRQIQRLAVGVSTVSATKLLEDAQVLQYFDFAGLAESVEEVSSRIFQASTHTSFQKRVLYIEGLGATIESAQRRSGVVQANALLTALLRTVTHLSRIYPHLLVVLGLDLRLDSRVDDGIQSVFASGTGSDLRMDPRGALGRTLEGALDVVVLVHNAYGTAMNGSTIVEVVKDRLGDTVGEWAVWKV